MTNFAALESAVDKTLLTHTAARVALAQAVTAAVRGIWPAADWRHDIATTGACMTVASAELYVMYRYEMWVVEINLNPARKGSSSRNILQGGGKTPQDAMKSAVTQTFQHNALLIRDALGAPA